MIVKLCSVLNHDRQLLSYLSMKQTNLFIKAFICFKFKGISHRCYMVLYHTYFILYRCLAAKPSTIVHHEFQPRTSIVFYTHRSMRPLLCSILQLGRDERIVNQHRTNAKYKELYIYIKRKKKELRKIDGNKNHSTEKANRNRRFGALSNKQNLQRLILFKKKKKRVSF